MSKYRISSENVKKGKLFIVSAPAGAGKTTLVEMLLKEFNNVARSISYTTRRPRGTEVNGVDYHFIDIPQFLNMRDAGEFAESAEVFGHFYGTSKKDLQNALDFGKSMILVIDTQGAEKIRKVMDQISIFIMPPSLEALETRLRKRQTETEEEIQKRLSYAKGEMDCAPLYDCKVINDDLNRAYQELRRIFLRETLDSL